MEPEGIKLNYIPMQSEEIFWRMGHHREFDVSEMSLSNHVTMIGQGNSPFVGIPIFPVALLSGIPPSTTTSTRELKNPKTSKAKRSARRSTR